MATRQFTNTTRDAVGTSIVKESAGRLTPGSSGAVYLVQATCRDCDQGAVVELGEEFPDFLEESLGARTLGVGVSLSSVVAILVWLLRTASSLSPYLSLSSTYI